MDTIPGDTFKRIFLNENVMISIKIPLKFVPMGPINNNPALVQIMAWRRLGDKPLSEPMIVYRRIYASLGLNKVTFQYISTYGVGEGESLYLSWCSTLTMWVGHLTFIKYHHRGCLNGPIFSNLWSCAAC